MHHSIELSSPEKLHMRPCGVIVRFAQEVTSNNQGIELSLSYSGKKAKATSLIALSLLGIQKDGVFSLEIEGGNPDQIEKIVASFKELVTTKLGDPELHDGHRKLIAPLGIQLRNKDEKHPEYDKFQERYDFLIRAKRFLEKYREYFYRPEVFIYDEYERIRKLATSLGEEEKSIVERHSMVLYDGGRIIGYLCRDNPHRESRNDEHERALKYKIPASILEAQRHIGNIPDEILQPIYHNFHIVLVLQSKLDDFHDGEELKNACDITFKSMLPGDKANIYMIIGHKFIENYSRYTFDTLEDLKENALNEYKKNMRESIEYIIKHVQEFFYPTRLRTYKKNLTNV